MQKKYLFD